MNKQSANKQEQIDLNVCSLYKINIFLDLRSRNRIIGLHQYRWQVWIVGNQLLTLLSIGNRISGAYGHSKVLKINEAIAAKRYVMVFAQDTVSYFDLFKNFLKRAFGNDKATYSEKPYPILYSNGTLRAPHTVNA